MFFSGRARIPRFLLRGHDSYATKRSILSRLIILLAFIPVLATSALGQRRGTIAGVVKSVTNPSGIVVLATNQVTSKVTRTAVAGDGRYSLKLRPGAYRLSVELPYTAKFDKAKNYGEHALIREDSLENVIVSDSREMT